MSLKRKADDDSVFGADSDSESDDVGCQEAKQHGKTQDEMILEMLPDHDSEDDDDTHDPEFQGMMESRRLRTALRLKDDLDRRRLVGIREDEEKMEEEFKDSTFSELPDDRKILIGHALMDEYTTTTTTTRTDKDKEVADECEAIERGEWRFDHGFDKVSKCLHVCLASMTSYFDPKQQTEPVTSTTSLFQQTQDAITRHVEINRDDTILYMVNNGGLTATEAEKLLDEPSDSLQLFQYILGVNRQRRAHLAQLYRDALRSFGVPDQEKRAEMFFQLCDESARNDGHLNIALQNTMYFTKRTGSIADCSFDNNMALAMGFVGAGESVLQSIPTRLFYKAKIRLQIKGLKLLGDRVYGEIEYRGQPTGAYSPYIPEHLKEVVEEQPDLAGSLLHTLREVFSDIHHQREFNEYCTHTSQVNAALQSHFNAPLDSTLRIGDIQQHILSFRDCMFNCYTCEAVTHSEGRKLGWVACNFIDDFFLPHMYYTNSAGFVLDENGERIKKDWTEISTPAHDEVMNSQRWSTDYDPDHNIFGTVWWCYFFDGRCFFPVNKYDGIQRVMAHVGEAGTGKSTMVERWKFVFPPHRVYTSGSCNERTFGLANSVGAYLCIMPEMNSDHPIQQGTFNTMASGDFMEIPVKNRKALQLQWKACVVVAFNEQKNLNDAQGQSTRRLAMFPYEYMIQNHLKKNGLRQKLHKEEIPPFILKAALAYKLGREKFCRDGQKGDISAYFSMQMKQRIQQFTMSANPVVAFLEDRGMVVWNEQLRYILDNGGRHPETKENLPQPDFENLKNEAYLFHDFRADIREWSKSEEVQTHMNADAIRSACKRSGLIIRDEADIMYKGQRRSGEFIFGIKRGDKVIDSTNDQIGGIAAAFVHVSEET